MRDVSVYLTFFFLGAFVYHSFMPRSRRGAWIALALGGIIGVLMLVSIFTPA